MRNGPDYIQFYPTLRCNKSCDFCFNRDMSPAPDMSLNNFRRMLVVLKGARVKTLDIIGGEPTLHPDIATFVREAVQQGLSVNLSSNGTDLPLLAEMMQMGQQVTVGISINDRDSLVRAKKFIGTHKPVVKSIYRHGLDSCLVNEILSLAPQRYFLIYRDALDPAELNEAFPFHQFLSEMEKRYDPEQVGMVYCSGFLPDTKQYPELCGVRCPAGTTKLGIMPDGSVYPCNLFFGKKEFLLGNILTDPFHAVWNINKLTFFRTAQKNSCPDRSCVLHDRCHGGCPAHSFAYTGQLEEADPRCHPS